MTVKSTTITGELENTALDPDGSITGEERGDDVLRDEDVVLEGGESRNEGEERLLYEVMTAVTMTQHKLADLQPHSAKRLDHNVRQTRRPYHTIQYNTI